MKKFVPLEKRSKRQQREWYKARRKTWGDFSPVTRRPENPKAYKRKKVGRNDDFGQPFCFALKFFYLPRALT